MKKITLLMCFCAITAFSQSIGITTFATGFTNPTELTNAGDDRMFLVQKGGAIKIVNANGTVNPVNFLTLTTATIATSNSAQDERGLLGLAFHPDYDTNGYFYVNYTRAGDGATAIVRYSVSSDANIADPSSATVLLNVAQPFSNHNGGSIKFGPDGYLYIAMGDGGSGGDPGNRAQNINNNLGKMLRIDVDSTAPYAIPVDNPFVDTDGNDEIWAVGLRNPWKFSFDKSNGDLWIADVGQGQVEEVNRVSSTAAGLNYGWKCYEGNSVFTPNCADSSTTYTFPLATLSHGGDGACSITGGYVYNGTMYPNFAGKYFFSDYCFEKIAMMSSDGTIAYSRAFNGQNPPVLSDITSFGEDADGELYVVSSANGTIYKIIDTSLTNHEFAAAGLSIYPNPAQSSFVIKSTNDISLKQMQLHDLSGKLLLTQQLLLKESNTMNVEGIQSGLYLVTVEDAAGKTFTSKLMIN